MVKACALCGDAAILARVVSVERGVAVVEADGCRESVDVSLVAPVKPGTLVLCHAGVALQRVDAR
jgi:hydrogenase assembly chaperone HypC/HupF